MYLKKRLNYSRYLVLFLSTVQIQFNFIEGGKHNAGPHDVPSPILMSGTKIL